eukprot:TRINITY_DN110046_c0_g1_i1.p2 TRINITY_DN110046_c0_g1~~TRINITY_DN110046_c0_g1_i1.p2  ORF type:complete len:110 (+),score=25.90 TRINITY_DN110046_c0_g1_i1:28-330(+)
MRGPRLLALALLALAVFGTSSSLCFSSGPLAAAALPRPASTAASLGLAGVIALPDAVAALDVTATPAEDPQSALLLLAPFQLLALFYVYKALKKIEQDKK